MATDKGTILVVDDEANARTALAELLRDEGYRVETAADGFKALGKMEETPPDLVLTDLKMPGMGGVEAMKKGAADYLTKPLNTTELFLVGEREMERRRLRQETGRLRARLAERYSFSNIIGSAPAMQAIFKTVAQGAPARSSILI